MTTMTELDERDRAILAERVAMLNADRGIRVGDFVSFAGMLRRVSHVYSERDWGSGWGVQTSDGGSFYLGESYCSFSGGLYPAVPGNTLTPTGEIRDGDVWFFHHDHATANGGVTASVAFRVWECSVGAPR